MKFAPRCRTNVVGMIYTILGSFANFLIGNGANTRPYIRPRKITITSISCTNNKFPTSILYVLSLADH